MTIQCFTRIFVRKPGRLALPWGWRTWASSMLCSTMRTGLPELQTGRSATLSSCKYRWRSSHRATCAALKGNGEKSATSCPQALEQGRSGGSGGGLEFGARPEYVLGGPGRNRTTDTRIFNLRVEGLCGWRHDGRSLALAQCRGLLWGQSGLGITTQTLPRGRLANRPPIPRLCP
jgi:hypothetical protein